MEKHKIKARLIRILEISPPLKEILLSSDSVDEKRERISRLLGDLLDATFYDDKTIPPLEWVLMRDTIRVFRSIISPRSERLIGHSFLRYVNDLLHKDDLKDLNGPEQGFLAELEHLLKGLMGKTGIYPKTIPAFSRHEGQKGSPSQIGGSFQNGQVSHTDYGWLSLWPGSCRNQKAQ